MSAFLTSGIYDSAASTPPFYKAVNWTMKDATIWGFSSFHPICNSCQIQAFSYLQVKQTLVY
jgi:hypothetical protein